MMSDATPTQQPGVNFTGKVALIGAQGMLGRAWQQLLQSKNIEYTALDLPGFNVLSPEHVANQIDDASSLIINCAAWTDVDGAETQEAQAYALNCEAVALLAARAKANGSRLLHYSTDYVFDGQADQPWPVDALPCPINAYGRTKAAGEMKLIESGCNFLLVRTSSLYAPWPRNFVLTIADLARQRDTLKVVNDQVSRPTSATHLAAASFSLAAGENCGIWHVTDSGQASWFDLACHVVKTLRLPCQVEPCSTAEMPRPARRPAFSALDISQSETRLGLFPHWQEHVEQALQQAE